MTVWHARISIKLHLNAVICKNLCIGKAVVTEFVKPCDLDIHWLKDREGHRHIKRRKIVRQEILLVGSLVSSYRF